MLYKIATVLGLVMVGLIASGPQPIAQPPRQHNFKVTITNQLDSPVRFKRIGDGVREHAVEDLMAGGSARFDLQLSSAQVFAAWHNRELVGTFELKHQDLANFSGIRLVATETGLVPAVVPR